MTEKRYYFTYWDEEVQSYTWIPLAQWWRFFDKDPFEDFDKFKKIFRLPYPSGCNENNFYYHWDDLNWENVWVYMNYLKTGTELKYKFHKGNRSYAKYMWSFRADATAACRNHHKNQSPSIEFMN